MREHDKKATDVMIGCTTQKLLFFLTLLLSMVLSTSSSVFSQDSSKTIPELWDEYKSSSEDTTQILALAELGFIYLRAKPDSALLLSEEAYRRAENLKFDSGLAASSISLAEAYALRGMQDSALVYYNRGANLYAQLKNKSGMSRAYKTRGLFQFSRGKLKEAQQDLDKALLIERNLFRQKQEITTRWNSFLVFALAAIIGLLVAVLVLYYRSRSLNRNLETAYADLGEQNVKVRSVNQKLEIANNKLQQFAFAAGHDLKESLRNITSFTQLASREMPADSAAKEHLQIAAQGGKRMKKMLEDLLNYSKVDVTEAENHWIPLNEVVRSVKHLLQEDINASKGDIHQQINLRFKADRIAMEQLLFNLLHNGLKYHQSGVPPRISVNAEERPEGLVFLIRDNGIGVDKDYIESIFEPFARLHNRDLSGSGLGLAICKRIVQGYGGRIWVESPKDGASGSVFAFTIPQAKPQLLTNSLA